jgi:CHAT domain-containing protein
VVTDPPPSMLHIATHGFWLDRRSPSAPTASATTTGEFVDVPTNRSGLAFAGANLPEHDGILTAEQIGHLDLRGTSLVVLSACDTGLGSAHVTEGVFSLSRAFAIAGAQSVITSLWRLPDAPSAELMERFYEALEQSPMRDPAAALCRVQAEFATEGRHAKEWGGYICHTGFPARKAVR